ncbi:hypothetical protein SAMN05660976_05365 [Nonomuraea pusilla]|uniref:Uncharacterized protein n=1 Tax=Nonomuraea pusilla TaxID=46177 RepID=A0A1H7Z1H0_9ACTN|nr:hypothetical protein SAMN05660976_05365 [Nonomuraea pusilla]
MAPVPPPDGIRHERANGHPVRSRRETNRADAGRAGAAAQAGVRRRNRPGPPRRHEPCGHEPCGHVGRAAGAMQRAGTGQQDRQARVRPGPDRQAYGRPNTRQPWQQSRPAGSPGACGRRCGGAAAGGQTGVRLARTKAGHAGSCHQAAVGAVPGVADWACGGAVWEGGWACGWARSTGWGTGGWCQARRVCRMSRLSRCHEEDVRATVAGRTSVPGDRRTVRGGGGPRRPCRGRWPRRRGSARSSGCAGRARRARPCA